MYDEHIFHLYFNVEHKKLIIGVAHQLRNRLVISLPPCLNSPWKATLSVASCGYYVTLTDLVLYFCYSDRFISHFVCFGKQTSVFSVW